MGKLRKQFIVFIIAFLPGCILALGLGNISLQSALYQPFNAEIGLIDAESVNIQNVKVGLASADEFKKVDLDRPFILSELQFAIVNDVDGKPLVKVTSEQPIKEPYMSFLVNISWPQGEIIRQYTVLLDPPTYQNDEAESLAANKNLPTVATDAHSASNDSQSLSQTKAANLAAPIDDQTKLDNEKFFGPITGQENLWVVAQQLKPKSKLSLRDIMLSLYRANPSAFVDGNINKLQLGSMLSIPNNITDGSRTIPRQAIEPVGTVKNRQPEPMVKVTTTTADSLRNSSGNSIQAVGDVINQPLTQPTVQMASQAIVQPTTSLQQSLSLEPVASPATNSQAGAVTPIKLQGTQSNELQTVVQPKNSNTQNTQQLQSELEITSQSYNTANQANQLLKLQLQQAEQKNKELQQQLGKVAPVANEVTNSSTVTQVPATQLAPPQSTPAPSKLVSVQTSGQAFTADDITSKYTFQIFIALIFVAAMGLLILWRALFSPKNKSVIDGQVQLEKILEEEKAKTKVTSIMPTEKLTDQLAATVDKKIDDQFKINTKEKTIKSDGDPMQEAEVYINYGRYGQAENILVAATKTDPDNSELWAMLLKVYAETFNSPDFEACVFSLPESMVINEDIRKMITQLRKSTWKLDGPPQKSLDRISNTEQAATQSRQVKGASANLNAKESPGVSEDTFKELEMTEETEEFQENKTVTGDVGKAQEKPPAAAQLDMAVERPQEVAQLDMAVEKPQEVAQLDIAVEKPQEVAQLDMAVEKPQVVAQIDVAIEKFSEDKSSVNVEKSEHTESDFLSHEFEDESEWDDPVPTVVPETLAVEVTSEAPAVEADKPSLNAAPISVGKSEKTENPELSESTELSLDGEEAVPNEKPEPETIENVGEVIIHAEIKPSDAQELDVSIVENIGAKTIDGGEQSENLIRDVSSAFEIQHADNSDKNIAEEEKPVAQSREEVINNLDLAVDLGGGTESIELAKNGPLSDEDAHLVEGLIELENSEGDKAKSNNVAEEELMAISSVEEKSSEDKFTQYESSFEFDDTKIKKINPDIAVADNMQEPKLTIEKIEAELDEIATLANESKKIVEDNVTILANSFEIVKEKSPAKKSPTATDVDSEYSELTVENSAATKLDLAQAYIEMGDQDAARKMLTAVINEGDKKYLSEAENLLAKLSKDK